MKRRSLLQALCGGLLLGGRCFSAFGRDTGAIPAGPPHRPYRIAAPDRGGTQTVLALGKVPVVSVSREFYNGMGTTPPLPMGIADSGDPTEPNLEVLLQSRVELIVTVTISPVIRDQLRRIAPVFALDIYNGAGHTYRQACRETLRLATLLGDTAAGTGLIDRIEDRLVRTGQALAGYRGQTFILAGLSPDGRHMTVYGRKSIMSDVMHRLGMADGWSYPTNDYGFTNAGIETLAASTDAQLMVIDYGESTRAALRALSASPLWRALPMVRRRKVFLLPRIEVFGALPMAEQFADRFSQAILRPERIYA